MRAGTLSVLEGARRLSDELQVRVYQASSSEMFGAPRDFPQTEQTPFRPRNPYACSKVYGFHQAVCFRDAYQLFVCNGILFNHESPRRPAHYVTRKITRAAARIAAGLEQEIVLGNSISRGVRLGITLPNMWRPCGVCSSSRRLGIT